ncbi:stalk domain-containing protein [Paenibacillus tarimensis]|uniref:stalk domain-containing protein n=1 Tax=Paenibacillus tarimensis TaxID=416012 RepID=UPI001EECB256|nr:stalk domain-containing protein [Paenibacillus tarimensis]MCF2943174.1 copper amine oxidase [Paenibacillus tarimensis]
MKQKISFIVLAACLFLSTIHASVSAAASAHADIQAFEPTSLIKADGTFWVWENRAGGAQTGRLSVPTQIHGLTDVAASFPDHLVMKEDGTVWLWERDPSTLTFQVYPVEKLNNLAAVLPGNKESLALDVQGRVYIIPRDYELTYSDLEKILMIPGVTNIKAVTNYYDGDYQLRWLLLKEDGTVLRDTGSLETFEPLTSMVDIIDIQHNLALKEDGTVWSLPSAASGLQESKGHGNASKLNGLSDIRSITGGTYSSLAIDSESRLWFWGATYTGYSDGTSLHEHSKPVRLTSIRNVKKAYVIERSIVALTQEGKVYSASINREQMPADPEFTLLASGVSQIKKGDRHIIMQKIDGSLWGWGMNKDAQLGHGDFQIEYKTPVQVQRPISVVLNGESVALSSGVIIRNNQAFIPLRSVFEKMGAGISFNTGADGTSKYVVIKRNDKAAAPVEITIDYKSGNAVLNGQTIKLPNKPFIVAGIAYLPLRFVSESLGANVSWAQQEGRITITTEQ